ncbi:MAG TPA: hypothetical protein PL143_20250, partial [Rhodocyclaceae bacterium]|nr:hypothetical protein [Rhodocyclaceae bacterium]
VPGELLLQLRQALVAQFDQPLQVANALFELAQAAVGLLERLLARDELGLLLGQLDVEVVGEAANAKQALELVD